MLPIQFRWQDSTPDDLEELAAVLAQAAGALAVTMRTGPADKGYDVDVSFESFDPFGVSVRERWLIECKNYSKGVPFSALEGARGAVDVECPDVLLVVTTSHLSTSCREQMRSWVARKHTRLVLWERPDLETLVVQNPLALSWCVGKGIARLNDGVLPADPEKPRDAGFLTVHYRYRLTGDEVSRLEAAASFMEYIQDIFVSHELDQSYFEASMGLINHPEHMRVIAATVAVEIESRRFNEAVLQGADEATLALCQDRLRSAVDELERRAKRSSLVD